MSAARSLRESGRGGEAEAKGVSVENPQGESFRGPLGQDDEAVERGDEVREKRATVHGFRGGGDNGQPIEGGGRGV